MADHVADTGVISWFGMTTPIGWLECDGAAVNRTTYSDLFAEIGTAYGVGDGSSTFNVPDFLGRTIVGEGTGVGLSARANGDEGGVETHQVSEAELANHKHFVYNGGGGVQYLGSGNKRSTYPDTGSAGSDTAHDNIMPSLALTPCIKT